MLASSGEMTPLAPAPLDTFPATMGPSDSLSTRHDFALGLYVPPSPDVGGRGGPLLFPVEPSPRALLHTPGTSCTHPALAGAVCCLRRDMSGSANPSLSGVYLTGLQGSLDVGPTALLPSHSPYGELRALDAPLGHGDLSPGLEPATRRSGAYRDGTSTRKSDTAQFTLRRAVLFRTHHALESSIRLRKA